MKTSIKRIASVAVIIQMIVMVSSCKKDYLNIGDYFDDEFNIDSAFSNPQNIEAYMWGAAAMFPDESNTIRAGYTPGPMATDEGLNGLTGGGASNIYYGMDFATGRISPDFFGDSNPNLNQWGNYYKIIRKCNSILQNLDRPRGFTNADRLRIEGYTRFIRAYAYYNILVDYGPAILLGDEVVNTNEPIEYYDRTRGTYDETMEYTCGEFEKAATLLPKESSLLDFGRPTKGAAFALIARLRLIHASPLFNGGPVASAYFGNWKRKTDNVNYVSQQYDESRWAVAAAAAKRVMDMGQYRLYTVVSDDKTPSLPQGVTSDPSFYSNYPNGAAGIDPLRSYSDIFTGEAVAAINKELIWGRNTDYLEKTISQGSMPPSLGGWGRFCVTQKVVDAYLMDDGRTREEASADGYYSETGFTEKPRNFSGYPLNSGVYKMYANREMRFYASIGFNEAIWQAQSSTSLNNHTAKYYYQDADGRGGVTATSPNYPITGYVIKKYNHPMDAFQGTGARHIKKAYSIIRYAEILLSYAEALNNLTGSHTVTLGDREYTVSRDVEQVKAAFNLVRYRAGLPGLSSAQLSSAPEVQKQIVRERMVEFLWENRRFYDVRRWGIYEETEREPIRGMNPDGSTKETYYQRVIPGTSSFMTRIVNKKLVFMPIPRAELRRLPSVDQNPGY
ncbi:putative outer membrane starch-binding protein [Arcticibacter tournemirensis]|uniref:RagB/SusD family nutrient uptake outer membrane protein n=1 Tax=Arcticibacter tournemirensis TaxID=699437 RepID=A0A5M9HJE5_9SPHI|nr:RagB/SusD family nutrient uptake outer membrane protein [Arcticibacter tournemirensis]KAA8486830.1 RagB/SusD family nutrient uptake outer membrane protein [Arcticibacter tournemirensis]TQM49378.1 putative outer membrane starch-binding protein [Arcticibacter tournemirensis]